MGVKVLDRFSRADSSSSLGSAESGQAWTATTGTWGVSGGMAYSSAYPTNSSVFGDLAVALVDAAETVQSVWATIANDVAQGHSTGIIARFTDINNFWYAFLYKSNGSPFNTFLYAGKVVANVNTYNIVSAVQMPTGLLFPATIGITVDSGNVWRAYCNGVQLGSAVTDSFNSTATKVGLFQEHQTTARLDDFLVFTPNGSFLSAEASGGRSPYSRAVIGLSPDVYWPMEEASGAVIKDRSGNGVDLNVAGTPTLGAADPLPGGASASVSGWSNSNRLTRNTATAFDVGAGDFTLMFWGNFDPTQVAGKPWAMVPFAYDSMSAGSNGMMADGVLIYLLTTGYNAVRVYIAGSFADYSGAGAPGVDNATHCFIVERVSGVVTVYIDNVSAGSSTLSGNASPASSGTGRRITFGGDVSNSTFNYYTQGRQAHTAFWKRALTAAERSLLHNAGRRLGVSV